MRSRYVARGGEISPLSRYAARPLDVSREAATPSENIYSFPLNELAEVSADNHSHGQAIACQAPDGLKARGSCWEEKSIHEATRSLRSGAKRRNQQLVTFLGSFEWLRG
jgi:hypothetical protein